MAKSKAKILQEGVSKFTTPVYPKTQRTPENFAAKTEITKEVLEWLSARYNALGPNEDKRLLRDAIDFQLRRYQGYAHAETVSHYETTKGKASPDVFEHTIPLCRARDMLIAGIITPIQAMYIPTCMVDKSQDTAIMKAGRGSSSDDYWLFFKRYDCFNDFIMTRDGQIIDPTKWTLADHYKHFKIA
jgi:hypothetical protein